MLIYNTTYHVEDEVHENFLIWLKEFFIPEVSKDGVLNSPRLSRLLSHREEGTCYALQWEAEDTTSLHHWHIEKEINYNKEMIRIFDNKVVGFPTLMEVIE